MKINLIKGDITKVVVDVIVNAANSSLLGGGGVDGAIHRAGGKQILEDCIQIRNRQGSCPAGQAVITRAGNLPAKAVIHTVGPVWQGGHQNEDQTLAACYQNPIDLALENGHKTIAFPNISTGVYRFPKARAAQIAINAVKNHPASNQLDQLIFVCFDEENYSLYESLLG